MRREPACFVRKQDSLACKWFFTRIKPETIRVEASGKSGRALHQMILCSNTDCDSPPLPSLCPQSLCWHINIHKFGSGSIPWSWKKTFQIVSFLTSSSASTLYMCSASNQRSGWRRFFMGWSSSVCLFAWLNKGSVKGLLKVRHSPRPESLIFLTFKDAAIFHPFILNEGRHLTIDSLSNSLSYTIQEYYALR